MATTAIGSFHARASLDASEFDRGAKQMATSISSAGRVIDDNWNAIGASARRSAEQSAAAFAKAGLGPIMEVQPIKQASTETAKLTVETKRLWAAQVQAKVAANALANSLGATSGGGAAAAVNRLNREQGAGSKAASRFGVIMQQSGYQVQDFAVQVAGGQSALVAFSQQGSQLLGIFGAAGAIAGAVLSVGVLGVRMLGLGDNIKQTKIEAESLKDSFLRLKKTKDNVFKDTAPLSSRQADALKKATEDADKLAAAEASLARLRADLDKKYPVNRFTGQRETPFIVGRGKAKEEIETLRKLAEYTGTIRANAAESQQELDRINSEANSAQNKAYAEAAKAQQEALRERIEAENYAYLLEEKAKQARKDEAEQIKDQLDPMRVKLRLQERMNFLVTKGALDQKDVDLYRFRELDLAQQRIRIPSAFQMSGGVSSTGGMVGGTSGATVIDLNRRMLAALEKITQNTALMADSN